jgi:hypothetical protein
MQRVRFSTIVRLVSLGCAALLVAWILVSGSLKTNVEPQIIASAPQQVPAVPTLPPTTPGVPTLPPTTPGVPTPVPTTEPLLGTATPARTSLPVPSPTVPVATPTLVPLQPPQLITPTLVITMTLDLNPDTSLHLIRAINSGEPVVSVAWAPTGDKLLYVTNSGKLYWCNLDGSNPTLLTTYQPDMTTFLLADQGPMTNTLLLRHVGAPQGLTRAPGHLDVVRFTPGQPPTLDEVPDAGAPFAIHWWSPNRASGIVYSQGDRSNKLVTVDANGHLVEERIIPYIGVGAVRPGGEWLAYDTSAQSTSEPFHGSDPQTAYLLNLTTGQRLQIGPTGTGGISYVSPWSPDGNWFLMSGEINGQVGTNAQGGVMLSSPDGLVRTLIPQLESGPVWSPDSRRMMSYSVNEAVLEPDRPLIPTGTPVPPSSTLYIADLASRRVSKADRRILPPNSPGLMMKPAWSPDGSQLVLLAWDPGCAGVDACSGVAPALYLMSTR